MENITLDNISGNLAEMRLIAEGAVQIFEKAEGAQSDVYDLIGEALYLLREKISNCQLIFQNRE